jgi:hypothetical protein
MAINQMFLIAVKRILDVSELYTKNKCLVEHVTGFFCNFSGFVVQMSVTTYLWKTLKLSRTTVASVTSSWFSVTSICRKSDGKLVKKVALKSALKCHNSDLIGGLFGCDLDQATLIDLNGVVVCNADVDW